MTQHLFNTAVVPHTLRWILINSEGNEAKLAEEFDVTDAEDTTEAIVESVTAVRNRLDLPRRLRDVDGVTKDGLRETAEIAYDDALMQNGPDDLQPTVKTIEDVLRAAW